MKKLSIAFVWHMHQPLYQDHVASCTYLPWVRLHALKGYYDLPSLFSRFPQFKCTFNITPSLLTQLHDYASGSSCVDEFLRVSIKNARDLTVQDKHFILSNFFMNNWQTIIKPHPHYNELLRKRGYEYRPQDSSAVRERFTDQDFLDLQVLFNLCWFGFTYRQENAQISNLIQKQKNYSESDKQKVIQFQFELIKKIIPLYKKLQDSCQIEVSSSPFYHPIMPLLFSGSPDFGFDWDRDLKVQLDKAITTYESFFERRPSGIWPPEGAVSRSIVPFLAERKLTWIASDEDILFESLGRKERMQTLYKPYSISSGGYTINILFRDRKLSDLIGFSYANSDPEHAASDFMSHIRSIHNAISGLPGNHIVPIILDGENPWEYYRDGGERFLSLLCEAISNEPDFQTVCISDYLRDHAATDELHALHAGSWINHNFDIWNAHDEDKAAWKYLAQARTALLTSDVAPEVEVKAWEEILIAQGSDWFWWYGDEFTSASDDVFDYLFRKHLANVYELLSLPVPDYLAEPIKNGARIKTEKDPVALISPDIDGRVTHYFEWENAGVISTEGLYGNICPSDQFITKIYFGFDLASLFFRLDFAENVNADVLRRCQASFELRTLHGRFQLRLAFETEPRLDLIKCFPDATREHIQDFSGVVAYKEILELSCPFADIGCLPQEALFFCFTLAKDDLIVEKWPRFSGISMTVPNADFEDTMWSA
jgi:alpha-amylase/alpha-mannosidase (GH57 family)